MAEVMRMDDGSGRNEAPRKTLLLTLAEAADELRVCSKTVRNLTSRGCFPLLKIGGSTRVRASDVERYLDELADEAGTDAAR